MPRLTWHISKGVSGYIYESRELTSVKGASVEINVL